MGNDKLNVWRHTSSEKPLKLCCPHHVIKRKISFDEAQSVPTFIALKLSQFSTKNDSHENIGMKISSIQIYFPVTIKSDKLVDQTTILPLTSWGT